MDNLITLVIATVVTLIFVRGYLNKLKKREELARQAAEKVARQRRDSSRLRAHS